MRKICILLVTFVLLFCGCGSQNISTEYKSGSTVFYYQISENNEMSGMSIVQSENRDESYDTVEAFFKSYFSGPRSSNLKSPFPYGTRVCSYKNLADAVQLQLSDEFFRASSIDFSIAACCLTKTVCGYLGVDYLVISDENNQNILTLYPEEYLLDYPTDTKRENAFTLFFPDSSYRYLIPETRSVFLSPNESTAEYIIGELISGPLRSEAVSICPIGLQLLSTSTYDKVCTVNFNSTLLTLEENDLDAFLFVYSIVNTLTGVDGINYVSFLCEGEPIKQLGCLSMKDPIARNTDLLNGANVSSGKLAVDIYVFDADEKKTFAVPYSVKQNTSEPIAETIAKIAVSYEPPAGMVNPVPFGTEILNASISGNVFYLDVSSKIIPVNDSLQAEQHIIWSVISTITSLESVDSVMLTIDGEPSGFTYIDISAPITFERAQLFVRH